MVSSLALTFGCTVKPKQEVIVLAASSLTNAFDEITAAFEATNPGVDVLVSYASSSDLATQLVQGAPADVFASANTKQMQVAADAGRISAEPVVFFDKSPHHYHAEGQPSRHSNLRRSG